jgi:hypothetical protein
MKRTQKRSTNRVQHPEDACSTAAYRLNVVLALLDYTDNQSINLAHDSDDDDGGYGLWAATDLIRSIRDELRAAANEASAERKLSEVDRTAGGAR